MVKEGAMKHLRRLLSLCTVVGLCAGLAGSVAKAQVGQVEIKNVEVRLSDHGPVILLKAEDRVLPIFVDPTVAGSIQGALTGQKMKRPLSHDLMHTILETFGGKVTRTVITLKDGVYYGELTVAMKDTLKGFDNGASHAVRLPINFKLPYGAVQG